MLEHEFVDQILGLSWAFLTSRKCRETGCALEVGPIPSCMHIDVMGFEVVEIFFVRAGEGTEVVYLHVSSSQCHQRTG